MNTTAIVAVVDFTFIGFCLGNIFQIWIRRGDDKVSHDDSVALPLVTGTASPPCVCGEPNSPNTIHRTDGPCYIPEEC